MHRSTDSKQKKVGVKSKRRRLRPEARRLELVEAALSVLRSQGPINARVEDVTEAAGAAKGTFYLYFSSWEDLLIEVRAHLLSKYITEMQKRFPVEALSDWWAAFEKECVYFVDFVEELGDLHKAIFHGQIADHPIDSPISSGTVVSWMLKTGIESGACRHVEIDVAARLLFSVLHTTADSIGQMGDRERYLNSMFDLLRAWLRTSAPAVM
ncbi:MAG: TetR/AcrR family transcriptional regulator [Acetobacter sp.]|nr:TetR/AcrR family transcriptional regulator [Acetobacter sp.]